MSIRSFVTVSLLLALGLGLVGFGPPSLRGTDRVPGDAASVLTANELTQARQAPFPSIQATAAAMVDGDSGVLIWGRSPHQSLPPASMTKIMTALVALQHGNLDQTVVSDVDAAKMVGDSVMGLHPGERLSLRDLLYGLLVPSGDDAALVIARAVGGDEGRFVALMNAEAASLGLTDTHFVNPHGLDAAGHVSSPYDMIVIARAAMRIPLFRQIVATQHVTIHGTWTYDLTNTNYFLGRRPEVIGVKTGYTEAALRAITVAADVDGHLLYLTVMHTPNYVPDVTALLTHLETTGTWVALALPATPLATVVVDGQPHTLVVAERAAPYVPNWQVPTLTEHLDLTPDSPLRVTDDPDLPPANAGAVTFSLGAEPVARLPLAAQ